MQISHLKTEKTPDDRQLELHFLAVVRCGGTLVKGQSTRGLYTQVLHNMGIDYNNNNNNNNNTCNNNNDFISSGLQTNFQYGPHGKNKYEQTCDQ